METTRTILLTRPCAQSEAVETALRSRLGRDTKVIISPVLAIAPTAQGFDPDRYGAFLFTSCNGVASVAATQDLAGRRAYCVGDRTAEAARAAGMRAQSAKGSADDLTRLLIEEDPPGPWLHISGEDVRVDLAKVLSEAGKPTKRHVAYVQVPKPLSAPAREALAETEVWLPVFSPRSAAILSGMVPEDARIVVFGLSQAVAGAWREENAEIHVATRPNLDEMLHLFEMRWNGDSQS